MLYLEFCIHKLGNTDVILHNFLLSIYVEEFDSPEGESRLIAFVKGNVRYFDMQYALRICSQQHRLHACVVLYGELGLLEDAVDYALKHHDLDLARVYADKPDHTSLRKKLWLRVAEYVASHKDVQKVIELVTDCDVLEIEDVLLLFPDFVTVDEFKEEICEALSRFSSVIESLKMDMNDASRSADAIRLDLRMLKKRFARITTTTKCLLCNQPLLTRSFHSFLCSHSFHSDCLLAVLLKENSTKTFHQKVMHLQERIGIVLMSDESVPASVVQVDSKLRPVQPSFARQLDELIGQDCVYCGEILIKNVDRPLYKIEDTELQSLWAL